MGNGKSKAGAPKDDEGFANFVQDYKNKHPELSEEQLQICCQKEWAKMSPEQKSLFKNATTNEDECLLPPMLENATTNEIQSELQTVLEEMATCSDASKEKQQGSRSAKPRACKAKTGCSLDSHQIKKKPYDRRTKPLKTKAVKQEEDSNLRCSLTNNRFMNYLREVRLTNNHIDVKTLAKQWMELPEEKKNEYGKKRE